MSVRVLVPLLLAGTGCAGVASYDYSSYLSHLPRSILVLPPLDETPEVNACYGWLATATRPLAEYGYYVFPVALVDRILRENGLPTPGEMHQVSLRKLDEVFGADSVLYVTVTDWGTTYKILTSDTTVSVTARLVDIRSGDLLWTGEASMTRASSEGQYEPIGMLISALINQIATSTSDPSPEVARQTNAQLLAKPERGLPLGPFHPGHEQSIRQTKALTARD